VLTLIADLPEGVVGVEAHGKVTADDYEEVLILPSKPPSGSRGTAAWGCCT
jgi:hypothetical protein